VERFSINELIKKTPYGEFDYVFLSNILQRYSKPRTIISRLLKNNHIIRVKKGIYVYGENSLGPPYSKEILANMIYGPSYISLEYALAYYNLIPERVETVTSISNKKNKSYQTPLGEFTYQYLPTPIFKLGIDRVTVDAKRTILIASKEKCLIDLIYKKKQPMNKNDIETFLKDNMRIDHTQLRQLHITKLEEISKAYRQDSIKTLINYIREIK